MENMTIGVFQVEKVSCGSYTVSFVKRIVGPASSGGSSDPISRLVGVEVNLVDDPPSDYIVRRARRLFA